MLEKGLRTLGYLGTFIYAMHLISQSTVFTDVIPTSLVPFVGSLFLLFTAFGVYFEFQGSNIPGATGKPS